MGDENLRVDPVVSAGSHYCLSMIQAVKERNLSRSDFDVGVEGMKSYRARDDYQKQYQSGFNAACRRADDFIKHDLTFEQMQRSASRIIRNFYPSDFLLTTQGINPDEAEASTVRNPKIFVISQRTPGSHLNTINVFAVVPAKIGEAEKILVTDIDKMGVRTTLLNDKSKVVEGSPNTSGQPFTMWVGLKPPVLEERKFKMVVTAEKIDEEEGKRKRLEIKFKDIPGSGNLKKFEGVARIWDTEPNRFVIHYQLFVDLGTSIPAWLVNRFQKSLFQDFARELLSYVK